VLNDHFVIDAVVHAFDLSDENFAYPRHARPIAEMYPGIMQLQGPGYEITREAIMRDWPMSDTVNLLFNESATDVAVYHPTPIFAFKDGMSSLEKAIESLEKWPNRIIGSYACVDPLEGKKAIADLDAQMSMFRPLGLKLYPTSWRVPGDPQGWRMDDPKVAFPMFEAAAERGIRNVAIHKAVPLGPVPTASAFVPTDVEGAADAFPEIQFEIVHGGAAFVDETAWLLGRYGNIWVNLEFLGMLGFYRPRLFEKALLGLMHIGGEAVIDRILWSSGTMQFHPKLQLDAFARFQFDDAVREQFGLFGPPPPPLTEEHKGKILGGNYARLHGLDVDAMKGAIADDEFSYDPADPPVPWSTTTVADQVVGVPA
jgi:predicted TIM-barrel fold metal-dependent hydrolase